MTLRTSPDSVALVQTARSFLFVPGDRPERFEKAVAARADVVIVDLEDAVGAEQKAFARESVIAWLGAGGRAAVRINAAGSPEHEADVKALTAVEGLLGVVLPKAADPAEASAVADQTGAAVVALAESAAGIVGASRLAAAEGVVRLAFGHLDYAVDLGSDNGWTAMLHARSTLVLASRAAGLPGPVDGVTVALEAPDELAHDLAHARNLGLTGKLLIHPGQVETTHAAYQPTDAEVSWAEKILATVRDATSRVVRVEGEMVDAPVVARAEALMQRRNR